MTLNLQVAGETPSAIIAQMESLHPGTKWVLREARRRAAHGKREIYEYQAAALHVLASQYNRAGARILEIGTFWGYSAAVMAEAAPEAQIVTLNPKAHEVPIARQNLSAYLNVKVVEAFSWDYLKDCDGQTFDMIFVDGDHKRVTLDLPFWEHIVPGGLFLFHDYSPDETPRPCPAVYQAVNEFAFANGVIFDVLVVDDTGVGMAGFYKP